MMFNELLDGLLAWAGDHQSVVVWLTILSAFTFVFSLLSLPWLVARIPADYFLPKKRRPAPWKNAHPVIRWLLLAGKNLLGVILLCGGFLMLFLPGQGLLTLCIGLFLVDFPGKFRLERRLVALPGILKGLNWLRRKTGSPPLQTEHP